MPIRTAGYARAGCVHGSSARERCSNVGGACDVPNDDSHDASHPPTPTDASLLVARGWFSGYVSRRGASDPLLNRDLSTRRDETLPSPRRYEPPGCREAAAVVAAGEPRIEFHFDISYYFLFFLAQACSVTEALNSGDTQQKDAGCMPVLRAPAAALSLSLAPRISRAA